MPIFSRYTRLGQNLQISSFNKTDAGNLCCEITLVNKEQTGNVLADKKCTDLYYKGQSSYYVCICIVPYGNL